MTKPFQIAIDGPIAAGKGAVSVSTAKLLNFLYVDTGAMYRTAALLAIENNIDLSDEQAICELIKKSDIQLRPPTENENDGRITTVLLDGRDVSQDIRTEEIAIATAKVAQLQQVRSLLVAKQQEIASQQNVVMEGRDITYRVLPEAQLKIFLTGSEMVRAQRRYNQQKNKGLDVTFDQVYRNLIERDKDDTQRATDPLRVVDGAWVIDSSDLSIDQITQMIVDKAKALMSEI